MWSFSLDHALSSAAVPFRRNESGNEFLTYVLETTVPGVHLNVDDDDRLPKSTISPHMLNSGRPLIVDSAREDNMIAGHLQNWEARGSDNAAMKKLDEQGSKGSPFPVSEEEKFTGDEPGHVVLDGISSGVSHSQCLQFLCREGPNFLMKNLKDKETICSELLTMAHNVKVFPPANEPLPRDLLHMTLWKASLCELVQETKTGRQFPFTDWELCCVCAHLIALRCISESIGSRDS